MKATIRSTYGSPEVLDVKEIDTPAPKDNEILIKVYAATVNRTDCHILTGRPLFMRLFTGLSKPRLATTGTDFAGQIESTGKNIKSFKAGDKVMGFEFFGLQSHAHYLVVKEDSEIVPIPANLDYDQAVACVEGAFYALAVINKINPKAGQTALVNGATGAIGSSMVQLFKFYGVHITATCSSENNELVKSLGAERLIDYKTNDFTKDSDRYDFVFDATGTSSFGRCKHLLKKKGIYSSSGGPNFMNLLILPLLGGKREIFAPPKNRKASLTFIKDLAEKGKFAPVIDRKYPVDKIAEAFAYVATGQKTGNVIITMEPYTL